MSRLRIRKANNNDWIDICQSEWYVRNAANTAWMRITPAGGLKIRHGTNNYWLNIDCLSEDCGDDLYGGTPDGLGDNGTGLPVTTPPPETGYPGESDGSTVDPWDPASWPPKEKPIETTPPLVIPPATNAGNNSVNNPDYTNPQADKSEEGEGDSSCANGTYSGGSYPPGYDLPDACGPNAGVIENPDGTKEIHRPGTDTNETYEDEPATTGNGAGTEEDPADCPSTISSTGKLLTEFYANIGSVSGQIDIEYDASTGFSGFVVYYAGAAVADSGGHVQGTGRLTFQYDSAAGGGDTNVFIRVRTDSPNNTWSVRIPCPGVKEEVGTLTNPASCLGNITPKGTGNITETVHEMGATAGTVVVAYQMFNIADQLDVYYGSSKVASTNGPVSNEGSVQFNYAPTGTNTKITIRVTSLNADTSWAYNISCPGEDGNKLDPKPCDNNTAVQSGGSGITDIYFDLGAEPGNSKLRYQAFNLPDTFEVYQGSTLLGSVTDAVGEGELAFPYAPAGGDVRVRVSGAGKTTWAFLVECPADPAVILTCGQTFADQTLAETIVAFTAVDNSFCLIEYATVIAGAAANPGTATPGNPDSIKVDYNGVLVEHTPYEYRYAAWGFGTLVLPNIPSINSVAVSRDTGTSWWQQTTYCPTAFPGVLGMSRFSKGVPHVHDGGNQTYYVSVWSAAKKIGLNPGLTMKARSCAVLMSMANIINGSLTISGQAASICNLYISGPNLAPTHIGEFNSTTNNVTISVAPGIYFFTALLENTANTDASSWFSAVVLEGSGRVPLITTNDWYGSYFETGLAFGNNAPLIAATSERIYDTDAAAQAYMSVTAPPSIQTIFNTWPRIDGAVYYANQSVANGAAASWSFNPSPDRFTQAQNTNYPNMIVSPTDYTSYILEAKIQSTDSDDDANGLVVAFNKTGNTLTALVVSRTCNGSFVQPTSKGLGLVLIVNGVETLKMAFDQGDWPSNGWSGRYTRVRAERSGNVIKFRASDYNSNVLGPEYSVNLTGDSAYAPFLTGGAVGFYTYSQANTTFSEVIIPGLAVNGNVYSIQTDTVWSSSGGSWVNQGSNRAFAPNAAPYTYATNPDTGLSYHIYRRTQRKA